MITTDTGAKKIEATDNWRQIFGAHNDTVDAYDANIESLQDALGIVVNGNQSAVSASSGQFIILKNSSIVDSGDVMLADGLYTAAKAIPANTVIDKTYLTADAAGGLNALNSKIENVENIASDIQDTTQTAVSDLSIVMARRWGHIVDFKLQGTITNQYGNMCRIKTKYAPKTALPVTAYIEVDGYAIPTYTHININGDVYVVNKGNAGKKTYVHATYLIYDS